MEKPKIKLNPLEKTAVSIPTLKKAKKLMRVYECGGLVWKGGDLPTESFSFWNIFKEETCVDADISFRGSEKGKFGYHHKEFYNENGWNVITDKTFYEIQKNNS